jgi:hypothetical protein
MQRQDAVKRGELREKKEELKKLGKISYQPFGPHRQTRR